MLVAPHTLSTRLVTGVALSSASLLLAAASVNTDYITPPSTFSPDQHYGMMIPVFHVETAEQADHRRNKVVDLRSGDVIAMIHVLRCLAGLKSYMPRQPDVYTLTALFAVWKLPYL
jgi:hypothetical protein